MRKHTARLSSFKYRQKQSFIIYIFQNRVLPKSNYLRFTEQKISMRKKSMSATNFCGFKYLYLFAKYLNEYRVMKREVPNVSFLILEASSRVLSIVMLTLGYKKKHFGRWKTGFQGSRRGFQYGERNIRNFTLHGMVFARKHCSS